MARDGVREGALDAAEGDMIQGVLQLDTRRVQSLMTPRHQVVWLSLDDAPSQVVAKVSQYPYSKFPVCGSSLDEVVGVVKARDVLAAHIQGAAFDLARLARPAFILPREPGRTTGSGWFPRGSVPPRSARGRVRERRGHRYCGRHPAGSSWRDASD